MAATAKAGDVIQMPDGVTFLLRKAAADTGGELLETEMTFPPRTAAPPPHRHPNQDEDYEVLSGTLDLLHGKEWHRLTEGQSMTVPRNTVHTVKNTSEGVTRALNTHRPALDFQEHMETVDGLIRAGKITSVKAPRSVVYMAMAWHVHRRSIVFANPVLRAGIPLLAGLGALLRLPLT